MTCQHCDHLPYARGLCAAHYRQQRRQALRAESRCAAPGCDRLRRRDSRTCVLHARTRPRCTVPGCTAPHEALGYCLRHYTRVYRLRSAR